MKQIVGQVLVRSNKRNTMAIVVFPTGRRVVVSMPDAHDQALSLVTGLKVRSVLQGTVSAIVARSLESTNV